MNPSPHPMAERVRVRGFLFGALVPFRLLHRYG